MGWYAQIFNHTRQEYSIFSYKYGRTTDLPQLWKQQPTWEITDVLVGGGMGEEYILLTGNDRYQLDSIQDPDHEPFYVDYTLTPITITT